MPTKIVKYSDKVIDHFRNPRNVGVLKGDDVAYGRVGNPVCGDLMEMYIRVKDNIITDIKFRTFGCASAIATSSMITELVKGKSLDYAMKVTRKDVADSLDGLPPIKMHCSNLAADALHEAIKNYKKGLRVGDKIPEPPETTVSCGVPADLSAEKGDTAAAEPELSDGHKPKIENIEKFENNGVYYGEVEPEKIADKRVIIIDTGRSAAELALKLTEYTGRVVLVTSGPSIKANDPALRKKLNRSDVKVLYNSEIIAIEGDDEPEKVKVHDKDENETYELFTDVLIIPA